MLSTAFDTTSTCCTDSSSSIAVGVSDSSCVHEVTCSSNSSVDCGYDTTSETDTSSLLQQPPHTNKTQLPYNNKKEVKLKHGDTSLTTNKKRDGMLLMLDLQNANQAILESCFAKNEYHHHEQHRTFKRLRQCEENEERDICFTATDATNDVSNMYPASSATTSCRTSFDDYGGNDVVVDEEDNDGDDEGEDDEDDEKEEDNEVDDDDDGFREDEIVKGICKLQECIESYKQERYTLQMEKMNRLQVMDSQSDDNVDKVDKNVNDNQLVMPNDVLFSFFDKLQTVTVVSSSSSVMELLLHSYMLVPSTSWQQQHHSSKKDESSVMNY